MLFNFYENDVLTLDIRKKSTMPLAIGLQPHNNWPLVLEDINCVKPAKVA